MTLTEFLLARIVDDEAAQWDLAAIDRPRWLAECEAKRRIVEEHPCASVPDRENPSERSLRCPRCRSDVGSDYMTSPWPCVTLSALAAVYADHPDYPGPKPKWTDLLGIDPDYTGGKPVDEFLEEGRGEA